MSDQGFEYVSTYPPHPDYDIYFHVFSYEYTVDPISVQRKSDRKTKKGKVLGNLTKEEATNKRRKVPELLPAGRKNMEIQEKNQMWRRRCRINNDLDYASIMISFSSDEEMLALYVTNMHLTIHD